MPKYNFENSLKILIVSTYLCQCFNMILKIHKKKKKINFNHVESIGD